MRREDMEEGGRLEEILKSIHSGTAAAELFAEREFLRILEGGCNAPCWRLVPDSGENDDDDGYVCKRRDSSGDF